MTIDLSPDLRLPIDAITETFVILAKRGSGKTYTAAVMAEQMIGAGHPVVVIDPIGVWWGLRASADGKGAGLPVAIFGGDHADLPLDEGSGAVVADAIVAEPSLAAAERHLQSRRDVLTALTTRGDAS